MRLSVIIPTINRRARLVRTLDALATQRGDVDGGAEVIVSDDGSTDGTIEVLRALEKNGEIAFFSGEHGGPARARNSAARAARGTILVFLGDDTVPEPGFLAVHERAHREASEPRAVLGYTGWDRSRMRVTPLLRHLNEKGLQFGYGLITDPENVPFNFFYTSNVSLPRDFFLALGGFEESFPFAVWEDVEFAWRAARVERPLRLVYRPGARAAHDHPFTVSEFRERQYRSGLAAAVFAKKHLEAAAFLGVADAKGVSSRRPAALAVLGTAISALDSLSLPLPAWVYDKVLRWDYLAGLKEGLAGALPSRERDSLPGDAEAKALH
jgi:GT2 family glycosyltransferase